MNNKCEKHNKPICYFCYDCQKFECIVCFLNNANCRKSHSLELIEIYIQKIEFSKKLNLEQEKHTDVFKATTSKIKDLANMSYNLEKECSKSIAQIRESIFKLVNTFISKFTQCQRIIGKSLEIIFKINTMDGNKISQDFNERQFSPIQQNQIYSELAKINENYSKSFEDLKSNLSILEYNSNLISKGKLGILSIVDNNSKMKDLYLMN